MKVWSRICAVVFVAGLATALADVTNTNTQKDTPMSNAVNTHEVAVINTTDGEMVIEFWPDIAPKTVANFKKLVLEKFYDGTCFHRIIKGFMIQGGDPLTKNPGRESEWGTGGPGYGIKAEFNNRPHEFGVISMARGSDPNSAGSQFFICDAPADSPSMQYLNGKYTAFGKLIKGDGTLRQIADTPIAPNSSGEMSKPQQRVDVISIKIVPRDTVK
jgi:peptidyl-prolyl cis-trans isomerase B (cyclophilin B)